MTRRANRTIPVSGGSWISVDVHGGPGEDALIIIPGVMSDAAAWEAVAVGLRAWPTVVVVNRRGRAPSGPLGDDYSLETEIEDALTVLREFPETRALFGWSYGGLIALHAASREGLPHVLAYEPVIGPFASHALPALEAAHHAQDWDESVRVVTEQISGMTLERARELRGDAATWNALAALSRPVFRETVALNTAPAPTGLAQRAERVDLIVGERNRGTAPYGLSFDEVSRLVPRAEIHVLADHGHMAHFEGPDDLARLIDRLSAVAATGDPA